MNLKDLRPGLLVQHTGQPQWGPGRVLAVRGDKVDIYFLDKPRRTPGDNITTLKEPSLALLVPAANQDDPWLAALPVRDGKVVFTHAPMTRQEAVAKFLSHFPEGFLDPKFAPHERTTKFAAHTRFAAFLDRARSEDMLGSGRIAEITAAVDDVFAPPLNLLHPNFELPRLREALADEAAAARLYAALFRLLEHDQFHAAAFGDYADAVASLPATPKRPVANWPVTTVLPFLARPDVHMLLRHGITEKAAQWLGYDLAYESKPNPRTYQRLLHLASMIRADLEARGTEALRPRDQIDIQSFLWVVGYYP